MPSRFSVVNLVSDKKETADSTPTLDVGTAAVDGNLCVFVTVAQNVGGDVTVTQPSGYSVPATNGNSNNTGDCVTQIAYKVASGESSTVSSSLSASRVWEVFYIEVNDTFGGTWTLDKSAKNSGGGSPASTGTTATTTDADEFAVGAIGIAKQATPSAPTNSFTLDPALVQVASSGAGSLLSGAVLYRILTAVGAYSTGVTLSTGRQWAANIATFYSTAALNVNTVAPVVSGTTEVGSSLSSTTGIWTGISPPSSYVYQWQRDNEGGGAYTSITGATSSTYTLVDADDACNMRCEVAAINAGGTAPYADSNSVGPVDEPVPVDLVLPEIAGAATARLGVTDGLWQNMAGSVATYSRAWEISANGTTGWSSITGDTEHDVDPSEIGKYVRVTVTATNTGGSTAATSAVFGPLVSTSLSYTVEMAFGSGPGTESPTWTDISTYVRSLTWNRGRQNELNQMQAGTGHMVLKDADSHFDPRNTGSPFYPDVRPGTPVRAFLHIGYASYPLFLMTTERQPRTLRVTDVYTERQIDMIDGFAILANAGVSGNTFGVEASDTRVNNILDAVGWPDSRRFIGTGISTLQNVTYADDAGVSAQQALLQVNDSENGLFFCDGNGDTVFIGRHQLIQEAGFTTSVATFGDAAAVAA